MKALVVINEITLFFVLWMRFIQRKEIIYVSIEPFIFLNMGFLTFCVKKLEKAKLIKHIDMLLTKELRFGEVAPGWLEYNEVEILIQQVMQKFRFLKENRLSKMPEYSYAVEKASIIVLKKKIIQLVKIHYLLGRNDGTSDKYQFSGITKNDVQLFNVCFPDTQIEKKAGIHFRQLYKICNGLNSILVFFSTLSCMLFRLRLRMKPKQFILAYDYHMKPAYVLSNKFTLPEIVLNSVQTSDDILFLFRKKIPGKSKKAIAEKLPGICFSSRHDGRLSIPLFSKLFVTSVLDIVKMYFLFSDVPCHLFRKIILLPYKKVKIYALLERFRLKAFLARDEYDEEHILRTAVLRKKHIISIGALHGLPIPGVTSIWRHIDYDVFFVLGSHLYKMMKSFWSNKTRVIASGSIHSMPYLRKMRENKQTRTNDIAYFQSPQNKNWQYLYEELFKIATYFSDRIIYIKPKLGREDRVQQFYAELDSMQNKPSNIEIYTGNPYELMLGIQYAITAGSTIAAEALQFKLPTFVFDVDPTLKYFYYKNFPDMCVKTGDDVIGWINDIEAQKRKYPFEKLTELINMDDNFDFSKTIQNIIYQ